LPKAPAPSGEARKGFGKVPKYLQKFNQEREEQIQQKAQEKEAAKCPPGTRKMDESERQDMLKELAATKAKIEDELNKFPISMKTMAIQKKREDLEQ
jgi:hypothetical protein